MTASEKKPERKLCLLCNKTFASASSLSTHKKKCRSKNNPEELLIKEKEERNKRELELLEKIRELESKLSNSSQNTNNDGSTVGLQTNQSNIPQSYPKFTPKSENVNGGKRYICSFCNRDDFSTSPSLSRHMKSCGKKAKLEEENKQLKEKLYEKDKKLQENKELISHLQKDKDHLHKDKQIMNKDKDKFADMAVNNQKLANASVSALNYFIMYNKETPPLEGIEDLSTLKIEYDSDTHFIEELLSLYRNEKLASYIGEYILGLYQKDDSTKQSLWSSDVDRLTYIIREAVKDKDEWVADKKGIKVLDRVIRPALDYIKPMLKAYIFDCNKKTMSRKLSESKHIELGERQKLASHIIILIENKVLEKDIIKYLAPQLYWKKNAANNIKQIECNEDDSEEESAKYKTSKPPKSVKVIHPPKKDKYIKQRTKPVKKRRARKKKLTRPPEPSIFHLDVEDLNDNDNTDSDNSFSESYFYDP